MSNLYLVNDDLRWETTDTKNIGFDFGLFNNKLSGSLNYYYNTTEDLLIEKSCRLLQVSTILLST